jgi:hypothetical protein
MEKPNQVLKIVAGIAGGIVGYVLVSHMFELRSRSSVDSQLSKLASEMNKKLPIMVDSETRWDTAFARPGRELGYIYTLPGKNKSDVDMPTFQKTIRDMIVNNYRTNAQMGDLRAAKVKLDYQYKDKNGANIGEITVSPSDF